MRLRFTGDVVPENAGDPPGEYAIYEPESGGIHVILDGVDGECAYHGTSDVTIVPNPMQHSRVQQGVDQPTYSLLATFPAATPPLSATVTGPEHCGGGDTVMYPLAGRVFLGMADGCVPALAVDDAGGHSDLPARPGDHEVELVARARGGLVDEEPGPRRRCDFTRSGRCPSHCEHGG